MSAPTVLEAAFTAAGNWAAAFLSDGGVFVLDLDPITPAWRALPALPAGTPASVGLSNGGAAVLVVMTDGSAYRLANEPGGGNNMTWLDLPPVPGTEAAG